MFTVMSGAEVVRKDDVCRGADDPIAREARERRGVPESAEAEGSSRALVGGVQDFEAGRGQPDEAMDGDERGSCSRGTTGARTLDCRS